MSIKSIEIKNFKSIEYIKFNLNELNVFIGKNGTGKTTIQKAIKYFYDNLLVDTSNNMVFDELNPLKKQMSITIEYDFLRIYELATGEYLDKLEKIIYKHNPFIKFEDCINTLKLTLQQTKYQGLVWSHNYDTRYLVKNSHPIYFLYPREKNLLDWDDLWNALGDLVNANAAKNFNDDLTKMLPDKDAKVFKEYIQLLDKFFKEQDLKIFQDSNTNKVISLLQLYFGGSTFVNKNKALEYYSDGTNSKNYILFLAYISYIVSMKRLKDVSVVLDEPEIGLHPRMIDELMDSIVTYSSKVNFILFSHSPRLTSHVLKNLGDVYKLSIRDNYTQINKLVKNKDLRTRLLVTEREASFLYSDFLLLTEGITEYEVFTNNYLQKLFPILKAIDVISTDSNNVIIDLINPEYNNSEIPYLILIDLDKIITFNPEKTNDFKLKFKSLNYTVIKNKKIKNKMIKSFKKYKSDLNILKHIENSEGKIFSNQGETGILPNSFYSLYNLIKQLHLKFNVYPLKVVIENALVSNDIFPQWLNHKKNLGAKEQELLTLYSDQAERYTLQSYIVSGKNNFLKDVASDNYPLKMSKYVKEFENMKIKKNSGWVTEYFDFYQKIVTDKSWTLQEEIKNFQINFPEIYAIIRKIEDLKK
ncbi:retron Eco8 family effector endonuclease [Enterococcus hirae]|uniref:retron Eco8 family effector endonuclease n=1 Tax=Enterococcus hirae TaxID=1354 RepID=UPI0013784336|nr:retron Eco8 family effector endonuclease [Enterococcus hirae]NBA18206.1 AAA family ATPase [Enterococcus hirae]